MNLHYDLASNEFKDPILYTFRRCPYAIRSRWSLLITNKNFYWREVNLKDKPQQLIDASSKGTVPVLVTNETIIEESKDIVIWAIKNTPYYESYVLYKNYIDELISKNDINFKYHLDRYKYFDRFDLDSKYYHRKKAIALLSEWNNLLSPDHNGNYWLVNGKETIADWCLWPFVRQFRNVDIEYFNSCNSLLKLINWLQFYIGNSKFNILMSKSKPWNRFDKPKHFPSFH